MDFNTPRDAPDPWIFRMKKGRFDSAWEISDELLRLRGGKVPWHLPRHLQTIWNGASLNGRRVLIRCYHGLGDTLQFIRYAPLLKAAASEVIVWVQPELIPLLGGMEGIDRFLPLHDGTPEVDFDVDVEIMELPYIFRTTLETIPAEVPYIGADPAPLPGGERLRAGIVWRSGEWGPARSIPFSLVAPLGKLPGLSWYVFQRGAGLMERSEDFGVLAGSDDILETARRVRALDLMVTVDTMAAHLAGALGTPVWTLLQADADWRWMEGREESPWYPSMRLFRQQTAGDWNPVIARLKQELKKLLEHRPPEIRRREIELSPFSHTAACRSMNVRAWGY